MWHPDSIKPAECTHQLLSSQRSIVKMVSSNAGECRRGELDQSTAVGSFNDFNSLNISVERENVVEKVWLTNSLNFEK